MQKTMGWSAGLVLTFMMALTACSERAVKTDQTGMGAAHSSDAHFSPTPPQEITSFRVTDPEPPSVVDKELETVPPEMQPKVEQWIAYFQGKGRPHMERYLGRSTRYIQLMKRIMKENGLPEDLVYIALIESGFSSRATSRAAAVGYWQFIKGTGRRYGLEINSYVDERRDPVLSTQAAAEYFKGLYSVFGSWYLSMASYNVGENRVKREVMTYFTRDFWELAPKRRFPKETVNYVPKFIAARLIARNPDKYGFSELELEKPLEFELIKVDRAINLRQMATHMGMDYEDFKLMNPKFKGEIAPTKSNAGLELRVPVGQSAQALVAAQSSFSDKVEFIADAGETETYRVRSGDSLYTIARKYHTTVAYLRDSNDLKAGKKLRIGMRLQVPDRGGSSRSTHKTSAVAVTKEKIVKVEKIEKAAEDTETAASNPEFVTKTGVFYIVQPGDTLSAIADEYDSSIAELKRMNKLGKGSMIKVGIKLHVPKDDGMPKSLEDGGSVSKAILPQLSSPEEASPLANANQSGEINHTVKAGENLSAIAKRYGVTVSELRQANNLKRKTKINSGMTLVIPLKSRPSGSVDTHSVRVPAGEKKFKQKLNGIAQLKLQKAQRQIHHSQMKVHVVRRGENLIHIANRYQVSVDALKEKNRLHNDSHILVGSKLLIPVTEARAF